MIGHAGTPRRAAQVCIGAAVQRAARLEVLATERAVPVLIDATTHTALAGRVATHSLPAAVLPGKQRQTAAK